MTHFMMKKQFFIFLLVLLLAVPCAQAENRTGVYDLDDERSIEFTETQYHSDKLRLSFWYDTTFLRVEEGTAESGNSIILYPTDGNYEYPVYMELLAPEPDTDYTLRFLEQTPESMGFTNASEIYLSVTDTGQGLATRLVFHKGMLHYFMTLWDADGHLNIHFQYPWNHRDDVFIRMEALLWTIQFDKQPKEKT